MKITFPELWLLPVLMLLDYFLTVTGAILAERTYRRHFKVAEYELNPIWQKAMQPGPTRPTARSTKSD